MTNAFLLDTHITLWLDSGDSNLRQSPRDLIDECWHDGGTIYVSAITAWEIALLADGGRIVLDLPVDAWNAAIHRQGWREGGVLGCENRIKSVSNSRARASRPGRPAIDCDGGRTWLSFDHL